MRARQLRAYVTATSNPPTVQDAARTAVAAVTSLLVARLLRLPEEYWSSIATLIVMQSTLGASLPVSAQRLAGTALGAAAGGLIGGYFGGNFWSFGVGVFLLGALCVVLRVERSAYRYASITLAIILLIQRSIPAWIVALHRFMEVTIGIAVGLAISAVWPERSIASQESDR